MRWTKNLSRYFISTTLLVFLACCNSTQNSQQNLPSWYVSPYPNNSQFLYGIGYGYTMIEAKNAALLEASSRLATTISGQTNLIRQENNLEAREEIFQNISEKSDEINFYNHEISRSAFIENIFYVEIKISRQEFIANSKKEISKLNQEIINLDNKSKSSNILQRLKSLQNIAPKSQKITLYSNILESLGQPQLKKNNSNKLQNLNNELQNLSSEIELYIDNSTDQNLRNILTKTLNSKNIKILNKKPTKPNKKQIILLAEINNVEKAIYNNFITNSQITLKSKANNKIIASNQLSFSASSLSSFKDSRRLALNNFAKAISDNDILQILGVNP